MKILSVLRRLALWAPAFVIGLGVPQAVELVDWGYTLLIYCALLLVVLLPSAAFAKAHADDDPALRDWLFEMCFSIAVAIPVGLLAAWIGAWLWGPVVAAAIMLGLVLTFLCCRSWVRRRKSRKSENVVNDPSGSSAGH